MVLEEKNLQNHRTWIHLRGGSLRREDTVEDGGQRGRAALYSLLRFIPWGGCKETPTSQSLSCDEFTGGAEKGGGGHRGAQPPSHPGCLPPESPLPWVPRAFPGDPGPLRPRLRGGWGVRGRHHLKGRQRGAGPTGSPGSSALPEKAREVRGVFHGTSSPCAYF